MKNGKNCAAVREDLSALVYGELDAPRRDVVEAHVARCDRCAEHARSLRGVAGLLGHWRGPTDDETGDARELTRAVVASARRRRSHRARPLLLGTAAAVLFFALLVGFGTNARYADGELTVSMRLPWREAALPTRSEPEPRHLTADEPEVQADTLPETRVVEIQDWIRRERDERLRLARAVDRARASDRRTVVQLLDKLSRETNQQTHRTREAILELASALTQRPH